MFVGGLQCHLISVSQLTKEKRCIMQTTDRLCLIQDRITKMLIGVAEQLSGLYFLRGMEFAGAMTRTDKASVEVWHQRLGHPSHGVLDRLSISNLSHDKSFQNKVCEICVKSKQARSVFPTSSNKTTTLFEMVHCDLLGPYRTKAHCGASYILTLIDDFFRSAWLYLLPTKQGVSATLKDFIAYVEKQFSTSLKCIRSDNGTEFMCMTSYFRGKGIIHETSCVGTPQQNGRVERKHRHILNVARALRFQASLPMEFWGECVMTAAYIINRTPTPILNGKTPFERLYNRPPPLSHLQVFGCLCYSHNQKRMGDKFASRSVKGVFIGYPSGKKDWRIYNPETEKIFSSRDVVFAEAEFPFAQVISTGTDLGSQQLPSEMEPTVHDVDDNPLLHMESHGVISEESSESFLEPASPDILISDPDTEDGLTEVEEDDVPVFQEEMETRMAGSDLPIISSCVPDTDPTLVASGSVPSSVPPPTSLQREAPVSPDMVNIDVITLGKGQREKRRPTKLQDYVLHTITPTHEVSPAPHSLSFTVDFERFSDSHKAYHVELMSYTILKNYAEAVMLKAWRDAVRFEIDALEENETWTVETLPKGKRELANGYLR